MYYYDYSKLKGKITEKMGTINNFVKNINLSEVSFYKKINQKTEFKQSEIVQICDILEIPIAEASNYFFEVKVKKNLTK